jgi:hypothetical protein
MDQKGSITVKAKYELVEAPLTKFVSLISAMLSHMSIFPACNIRAMEANMEP